jgi:hypothetical protein
VAFVIARSGNDRLGFATLLIPALVALGLLATARRRYPNPRAFETARQDASRQVQVPREHFPRAYWLFVGGGALIGFGFVDFALIAFHFEKAGTLTGGLIPISYAAAMGTGALGNYVLGQWFDRAGLPVLLGAFLVGALFTPLVFLGPAAFGWLGMALWGLNKGAQDTLLKPAIAPLIEAGRRSTAFGLFDTCFGLSWLAGSIVFGLLYDRSLATLVVVSVAGQLLALPLFVLGHREGRG